MSFEDPSAGWEYWAAFLVIGIGFAVAWHAAWALLPRRGAARPGGAVGGARVHDLQGRLRPPRPGAREHLLRLAARRARRVRLGAAPAADGLAGRRARSRSTLFASCARTRADLSIRCRAPSKLVDQARLLADGAATASGDRARRAAERLAKRAARRALARRDRRTARCTSIPSTPAWRGRSGLRWQPLPVFQSYSAYTAGARRAQRRHGARRRRAPTASCASNGSTSTTATRAFDVARGDARDRSATSARARRRSAAGSCSSATAPRCGRERRCSRPSTRQARRARADPRPRPTPTAPSFVRIDGIGVSGLERLRAAIYRALPRTIAFDGGRT